MQALKGLILAGGHSSRMGRDKAAIGYHGQMHTHYLARIMAPFVEKVFISIRKKQTNALFSQGIDKVVDYYALPSPLNGIVSAMRAMPETSFLVIAVDMPFINAAAIEILLSGRDKQAVATCFQSPIKGGPDPLFAIWEAHGFPLLETRIQGQTGHICPRTTLKSLPTHILTGQIEPRILENINTPEEWEAVKKVS